MTDTREVTEGSEASDGRASVNSKQEPGVPATLELHIEELVLRGFAPSDRFRIGDAVERELARLIAKQGLTGLDTNGLSIDRLDGGTFKVAPGAKAQTVGAQVAQTVYQKISPSTKPPVPDKQSKTKRLGR